MSFKDRYRSWRGDRPERRLGFLVPLTLTGAVLAAYPVQDLPVMPVVDTLWVGTAMSLAAAGAVVAGARAARGKRLRPLWFWFAGPALLAGVVVGAAVLYYESIGGLGDPSWLDLAVGPLVVGMAGIAGAATTRRSIVLRLPAVAALVVLFLAGGIWFFVDSGPLAERYARAEQTCSERGGVTYCVNPGFGPLINEWSPVIDGVLALVPADVAENPPPVVQEFDGPRPADAMAVPSQGWGRGSGEGIAQTTLALDVADWALGAEQEEIRPDDGEPPGLCDMSGQARAIVGMWLAGQVSPEAERTVTGLENDPYADSVSGSYADSSSGSRGAALYAIQLLARDDDEVHELILANWKELTEPTTSYGDAWRILDLDPSPGDDGKQVPFDPDDPESFMPPCG